MASVYARCSGIRMMHASSAFVTDTPAAVGGALAVQGWVILTLQSSGMVTVSDWRGGVSFVPWLVELVLLLGVIDGGGVMHSVTVVS